MVWRLVVLQDHLLLQVVNAPVLPLIVLVLVHDFVDAVGPLESVQVVPVSAQLCLHDDEVLRATVLDLADEVRVKQLIYTGPQGTLNN